MTDGTPEGWQVRVRLPAGPVCGAGILLSPAHVLTCAHVVPGGRTAPEGVAVDFPGSAELRALPARIVEWFPPSADRGDLAVLMLDSPVPPDVRPAPVRHCGPVTTGRDVRLYRHSPGTGHGAWVPARLTGPTASAVERVRLEGAEVTDFRLQLGFSGTGVVDATSGEVIGMLIAEDLVTGSEAAWMVPVETVTGYWPDLLAPSPAELVARRAGAVMELVTAVSELPSMRGQHGRDQVVNLLRWQIASAISRHPERRFDVLGIVRACLDHAGGLLELLDVLRGLEGDIAAMRRVEMAAIRLTG
jgi:Effector-associated domain 2/Trypsin-like peptidase domain